MAAVWQKRNLEGVRRGRALGAETWILFSFLQCWWRDCRRISYPVYAAICSAVTTAAPAPGATAKEVFADGFRYGTSVILLQKWLRNFYRIGLTAAVQS